MSSEDPAYATVWCDGRSERADRPIVGARDSAFLDGLGCYTTVSVEDGTPRWPERHARRLCRDARTLGLGSLPLERAREAVFEAARATLPNTTGALRLQCSSTPNVGLRLVGIPRALGGDPRQWRAVAATTRHWGPMPWGGAKISAHTPAVLARAEAQQRGVDEALLFDAGDHLIEGARSNLVVELASGEWITPDLARGGVSGIAREVLLGVFGAAIGTSLSVRDVPRSELASARAVVAINALRLGRRIAVLDGRPLGDVHADASTERIARALHAAPDLDPSAAEARQAC